MRQQIRSESPNYTLATATLSRSLRSADLSLRLRACSSQASLDSTASLACSSVSKARSDKRWGWPQCSMQVFYLFGPQIFPAPDLLTTPALQP